MELDLNNIKIEDLIPQRKPVVMLDRVVSFDEKSIVSALVVRADNFFAFAKFLSGPGILENIAQTAAAKSGLNSRMNNFPVPLGFIGAIKNLKIYNLPEIGKEIKTTVTTDFVISNATIINGSVFSDKQKIAECEMKIFIFNE